MSAWLLLLACGGNAQQVPFTCPEGTSLKVVDPRYGGRTAWCARRNDTKHGPWMEWHEDGTLLKSSHFHNNRRHGEHRQWYTTGQLLEEATYVEGRLHGTRTRYRLDGTVEAVETWVDGEPQRDAAAPGSPTD